MHPRIGTLFASLLCLLIGLATPGALIAQRLQDDQVAAFAKLAMKGIEQEYPNKPSNVMRGANDVLSPQEMHPVFYGCFDWHSSVHGHWLMVRLLKTYPGNSMEEEMRNLLRRQLTADKLAQETAYFEVDSNKSFERMYGWAWVYRLAAELHSWDDPEGKQWSENLRPLEQKLVELAKEYLPKLTFPIRTGQHPDTGFALAQALDYSRIVGDIKFAQQIEAFAKSKYTEDYDYPARYEPSGHDFFSTCLNEADLMRRVLDADAFSSWLTKFLPELDREDGTCRSLLTPAEVSDVTDGKLVHLAGLNFNRGWTQAGIMSKLPADDSRRRILEKSIAAHREAGLKYVFSGSYEGEHWLATFAVYLLTESGIDQ